MYTKHGKINTLVKNVAKFCCVQVHALEQFHSRYRICEHTLHTCNLLLMPLIYSDYNILGGVAVQWQLVIYEFIH